jgi:hypothetical protein
MQYIRDYMLTRDLHTLNSLVPQRDSRPQCKNCGERFTPYRSWQEFCSPPCRTQYYERYVRHPFSKALRELDDDEEKDCEEEKNEDEETGGEKNRGEG